jgi:hypothetical protein
MSWDEFVEWRESGRYWKEVVVSSTKLLAFSGAVALIGTIITRPKRDDVEPASGANALPGQQRT